LAESQPFGIANFWAFDQQGQQCHPPLLTTPELCFFDRLMVGLEQFSKISSEIALPATLIFLRLHQ